MNTPEGLTATHFSAGEPFPGMPVTVEHRGDDQWAVCYQGFVYSRNLASKYEPLPSSRTDAFKRTYRMSLEEAAAVAVKVCKIETDAMARIYGDKLKGRINA